MSTFVDLVNQQIEAEPDRIAVGFEGEQISFGQLGERVDAFAGYLLECDYEANALIALMMDRSIGMLVALLGIMKSGHAYLPIDPAFPRDRIEYMLDHSQVKVIVVNDDWRRETNNCDLTAHTPLAVLNFAELERQLPHCDSPLASAAKASDLAYVIYTSGSTGRPKGVMVTHDSVNNFLQSMANKPGLGRDDKMLAITTLSFDISVLELYLPLILGAQVEIVSKQVASDAQQLVNMLDRRPITVMQATPSTWKMMLDAGWQGKKSLKVLIGGEAPPKEIVTYLIRLCGEVWNMYGPTETTVWSSCCRVEDADNILIGEAIDNTQLHILDDELQAVEPGKEGILYIGGSGLAMGYLYRDDLTEERFVSIDSVGGERLYNTGDVVCQNSDGLLVYRRRADNQVKLRGFRIELGEIESHLNALPTISQSVVSVIAEGGDSHLVAYLTEKVSAAESDRPSVKMLRDYLKRQLPDYMVPNRYAIVDALPLLPNGKIDRHDLPGLTSVQWLENQDYVAPESELELAIAEVWQEVLGIDKISVDADFYELGGHSLLTTRIWTRLRNRLDLDLPLSKMFESPTIAALAQELRRLSDVGENQMKIPVISRMKAPLMSLAQQRFWYINQVVPHEEFYNLCSAFRLEGELDTELLEQGLNEIVKRHEILRTSLNWTGDYPKQVVVKNLTVELQQDDISHLAGAEQQTEILRRLQKQVGEKIALDRPPLFRVSLCKLNETNHVLFFMPHHVIWDGWSFDVFLRELKIIYEALLKAEEPALEPLAIQYADFAQWHHDYLSGSALETQLVYWQQQLGGDMPILDLPTDHPRPAQYSYNGATKSLTFNSDTVAAINHLAAECSVTVNMVVMTLYFVLLHRYTGQDDIIIGSPIQGRLNAETENMLGLFVNTLPLRVSLAGSPNFIDMLGRVRQTALEAYQNQEVPFDRLVEAIVSERDISRTPIFQALFTFQEVSERDAQMANLMLHQIELHNGTCPTDISLWVKSSPSRLTGAVEYNPDLFSEARISRFIEHLNQLVLSATRAPETTIDQLRLMTEDEQTKLFIDYNSTQREVGAFQSVSQLVDQQAKNQPNTVAVRSINTQCSYGELQQRSSQLAHKLLVEGVEPGHIVAVCMERLVEMPVVLMAIWKCGAAYLPIDPDFPSDRVQYILDHSKTTVIITQSNLEQSIQSGARKIFIDQLDYSSESLGETSVVLSAEMPAYVIYTSGSTGLPKGVVVSHGAVINFLNSMSRRPGLTRKDKLLAITTLLFDIHVLELWLPLTVGASVVLATAEQAENGADIAKLLDRESITVLQATPSSWNLLRACDWGGKADLKALVGGEAANSELIQYLLQRVASLWNMFGPTETTVWSSCHQVVAEEEQLLIGAAIDNTQLYVLDKALQLVPHNIEGELYIGGAGLSSGYLYDEQKTAEAFIEIKLPNGEMQRVYKTGDLVVVNEEGKLRYLRRNDNQVKVRGYRIELGEIELAFRSFPEIAQVVVIVREDRPGDQRICAYYVGESGKRVKATQTEFRKHLRKSLPRYMIPQLFIAIDALPLTPNGKIDRNALPAPVGSVRSLGDDIVLPKTECEKTIAKIWQELLNVEKVGIHHNFFEMGGHSFLAIKMIIDIEKKLGQQLTPRDVLAQDLSQLATMCDQKIQKNKANLATAPEKDKGKAVFGFLKKRWRQR